MSKVIVTWIKNLRFATDFQDTTDLQDTSVWPYLMQGQRSREWLAKPTLHSLRSLK